MAITQVSSVDVSQTAYNLAADYALRPELFYDAVADVKPTDQSMNGAAVKFTLFADLAAATTPLTETADITPATMSDSQVTVTLAEYGNAVQTTAKLRGTSFIPFDPVTANVLGYNAGLSIDTVVQPIINGGSNVFYGGAITSRATVASTTLYTAANGRRATAALRGRNAPTLGGSYIGYIHPDVAYDLQNDSAASNWYNPHAYSAPENIWNGELGKLGGIRYIETPRALMVADAGVGSTVDVYCTLILGRQSLAKAWSMADGNGQQPRIVPGPVTDTLRRFVPLGWYHLVGYGRYREACIQRYETASSIGVNT